MHPDFKELLSVLNAYSVKYLVVGAYALSIHAQPRATKDIDIWVKPDAENAEALYAALPKTGSHLSAQIGMRTPGPVGITMGSRITRCRSVTTPIQLRDCRTSMNTTCQSMKLSVSLVERCKIYAGVIIPVLQSVKLERDDI
jgi:hypothetical protein